MVDLKKIFSLNLIYLLKLNGKSQTDLAHDLNISLNTINGWYHAKTFPRTEVLVELANYFKVSVDSLININFINNENAKHSFPLQINFSENIKKLRNNANLSQEELANELQISRSSLANYEQGNREPCFAILELFANYFHIDFNTLLL